jgi:hypothetical protein
VLCRQERFAGILPSAEAECCGKDSQQYILNPGNALIASISIARPA